MRNGTGLTERIVYSEKISSRPLDYVHNAILECATVHYSYHTKNIINDLASILKKACKEIMRGNMYRRNATYCLQLVALKFHSYTAIGEGSSSPFCCVYCILKCLLGALNVLLSQPFSTAQLMHGGHVNTIQALATSVEKFLLHAGLGTCNCCCSCHSVYRQKLTFQEV